MCIFVCLSRESTFSGPFVHGMMWYMVLPQVDANVWLRAAFRPLMSSKSNVKARYDVIPPQ